MAIEKTTTTNWNFKTHQAKGFISGRNFHNLSRKEVDTKELLPTKGF